MSVEFDTMHSKLQELEKSVDKLGTVIGEENNKSLATMDTELQTDKGINDTRFLHSVNTNFHLDRVRNECYRYVINAGTSTQYHRQNEYTIYNQILGTQTPGSVNIRAYISGDKVFVSTIEQTDVDKETVEDYKFESITVYCNKYIRDIPYGYTPLDMERSPFPYNTALTTT